MAKVAKKTTRTRRRDRKNIEKGAAHNPFNFQQYNSYNYRYSW